ncbi:putative metal-dependent enzyme (double-stranded beta helix superfamily) [Nocardioides cavernae]|uniref:Putative metal-dependent enzyme (Double-stranded beta helix superfamily) n=1 Tax=Nocardioides cavernae TaxID=1921566 RepID=A0A7Y9KRP3_9ACTN|nr:cysteine dioxygenase family protein [Nocardioides cavernae]NYE35562.1 putative metal-dependent enzyme (double-stranded beta helix superfamily) [Nocardioides cavernae]
MTTTFPAPHTPADRAGGRRQTARAALAQYLRDHDPLASADLDVPERTWSRVGTGAGADIWLITWPAGSSTGWHDHGSASGAFTVLTGSLTEYVWTGVARASTLAERSVREFDGSHIHDVVNHGTATAVSLHAYAPTLAAMTRYELVRGRLQVTSVEQRDVAW